MVVRENESRRDGTHENLLYRAFPSSTISPPPRPTSTSGPEAPLRALRFHEQQVNRGTNLMSNPTKPNSRQVRSVAELSAAASFVGYELQQLAQGAAMAPYLPLLNGYFNNANIEAFLVHYRNIRDFLYPRPLIRCPDPSNPKMSQVAIDTAIAFDFDSGWTDEFDKWKGVTGDDEADAINKCLQHVSYTRLDLKRDWPRPKMCNEIIKHFGRFLQRLQAEQREWFAGRADIRPLFPGLFD